MFHEHLLVPALCIRIQDPELKGESKTWVWRGTAVISALRQEDCNRLWASLCYTMNSELARTT